MRRTLILCLVGLVGVTSMTGCGLFRNSRRDCSNGRCAASGETRASSSKASPAVLAKVDAAKTSERVVITPEAPPAATGAIEMLPELPKTAPSAKRGETAPAAKIDGGAQEDEIIRRETALRQGKVVTRVADQEPPVPPKSAVAPIRVVPSGPANRAVEPRIAAPNVALPSTPETEKMVTLKSVEIHYGQADNFKSITGQVQEFGKTLRLRYADIGQEDRYGGAVILQGNADLSKLRDGCHVRVTGTLVPPTSRTGSAVYRVQTIEMLD